jgi:hypothetical protein
MNVGDMIDRLTSTRGIPFSGRTEQHATRCEAHRARADQLRRELGEARGKAGAIMSGAADSDDLDRDAAQLAALRARADLCVAGLIDSECRAVVAFGEFMRARLDDLQAMGDSHTAYREAEQRFEQFNELQRYAGGNVHGRGTFSAPVIAEAATNASRTMRQRLADSEVLR